MDGRNGWYKKRLEALRAERGNKCFMCDKTFGLEFAHLKPTALAGEGRGRNARVLDILKHPNSYLLLCKDCHTAFDNTNRVITVPVQ